MANCFFDRMGGYYDQSIGLSFWLPGPNNNGGNGTWSTTGGAGNGPSVLCGGAPYSGFPTSLSRLFSTTTSRDLYIGGHVLSNGLPPSAQWYPIFSVSDDQGKLFTLGYNSVGSFTLQQGDWPGNTGGNAFTNQVWVSSANIFTPNVTHKVEMHVYVDGTSAGTLQIKLDGTVVASTSGINTTVPGSNRNYCSLLSIWGPSGAGTNTFSNVYINDGSGTANNSYEGVCYVVTVFPTSDGAIMNFTPSTGTTGWNLVDPSSPDNNTANYVSTNNQGAQALFNFGSLPAGISSISIAEIATYVNKSGAGARALTGQAYKAGTTANITQVYLGDGNQYVRNKFNTNPIDGTPLTSTNLIANQYGFDVSV